MKKLLLPFIFLSGFMAISLPAWSATTELKTSSADLKSASSTTKGSYLVTLERRDPTKKSASVAAFSVIIDKDNTETITVDINGNNWEVAVTEHADGYSVDVKSDGVAQAKIPQVSFRNQTQFSLDGTEFKVSRKTVGDEPPALRVLFWDHNQNEWREATTL